MYLLSVLSLPNKPFLLSLNHFSITMGKREVFTWKKDHDILLAREMLVEVPHPFKAGTKERGRKWEEIALNLVKAGLKVTKRSVRERFEILYSEFKQRENDENKASGINFEYDELHKALTDINDKIHDYEEEQSEKETKEKAQAEDMRKKATEKLSETKKRNLDNGNEDEGIPKKRRAASVAEIMEKNMLRKMKECDDQMRVRERELDLRAEELRQQQQFQAMIPQQLQHQQQQQEQQQQQQQAMNLVFMNTLAEFIKKP